MVAVKQRPTQAVSRLPPNPLHEHQTSPNQCPRQGVWTSDRGRNLARVVPSTSQATVLPEDLASIVSATPQLAGRPLRLLTCSAGKLDDGATQQLADHLRTPVMAPNLAPSFI